MSRIGEFPVPTDAFLLADTLESVPDAWTAVDETVLAGTNDGCLISRDSNGTWTDAGPVPAGIRSLAVY